MPEIDEFSLTTVPIEARFNQTPLWTGTAFTWQHQDSHFLITNWHNVSGRDPNTEKHLSDTAAEPNILCGFFNSKNKNVGDKHCIEIQIRKEVNEVTWYVHPVLKRKVDVVAIPLIGDTSAITFYPINRMGSADLVAKIGMDVFVLGYPFGPGKTGLPVWKRGSLASEPDLVPDVNNYLLVDTASRPGMSGSPVILRSFGTHVTQGNNLFMSPGPANKLIGVYSGRLHTQDPLDAQIGMVWPAIYIQQIIDGRLREHG
jgi:hypothetical protein